MVHRRTSEQVHMNLQKKREGLSLLTLFFLTLIPNITADHNYCFDVKTNQIFKEVLWKGYNDCTEVKCTCSSCRSPEFSSQYPHEAVTHSFLELKHLGMQKLFLASVVTRMHVDTHRDMNTLIYI